MTIGRKTHEGKRPRYVAILAKLDEAQIRSALTSKHEDHVALALREWHLGFCALAFLSSWGGFAGLTEI